MSDPDPTDISVHIFTVSDSRSLADDESGDIIESVLNNHGYDIIGRKIIREDQSELLNSFQDAVGDPGTDVIISTGGTGISSRDRTIEITKSLLDKPMPGFGELFRSYSEQEVGSFTVMSRAIAGRANDSLIFALPGSTNAVDLAMGDIIIDILPHAVGEIHKE